MPRTCRPLVVADVVDDKQKPLRKSLEARLKVRAELRLVAKWFVKHHILEHDVIRKLLQRKLHVPTVHAVPVASQAAVQGPSPVAPAGGEPEDEDSDMVIRTRATLFAPRTCPMRCTDAAGAIAVAWPGREATAEALAVVCLRGSVHGGAKPARRLPVRDASGELNDVLGPAMHTSAAKRSIRDGAMAPQRYLQLCRE
eukprot:CAMPEP_0173391578 /NCGR_PEP_ID=MMETSP1356-20130122/18468_1 /TAXON_ID=77927 ORGANISM="Hemiselmis virescens, Strain PCC157" /NCGR_SAMPLE_ID=MMETSP1356 /ASSEMBLY_ACC=CAM_ASM_000847 /LENGTH=197 /DNA_ID=CAMNT_0014349233 /DNA_START=500 /DNA_END=1092 /DNA_ORIENTATION=+